MSFYESLLNSLEEAIIAVDVRKNILFINRAGEELLGFHSKSVRGKNLSSILGKNTAILPLINQVLKEMRPISGDTLLQKISENARFDFTVSPLIEKGNVEGVLMLLRQRLDLLNKVDDQFDSVMYLLSSVAHEIKNPLAGIRGGAQLLRKSAGIKKSEYVDIIIRETERLDNVVKSYLFAGRRPLFNRLNIHEVIEKAIKVLDPEIKLSEITLSRSYDPSLPPIRGDEGKLLQVFINIIKNAREAMLSGGTLYIKTKPAFEYIIEKEKEVKRRFAVITFEDTGTGIANNEIEKIFMPFYTHKKEGAGLGLAISKKIVHDHKGHIKVSSIKNRGASVIIYVPFAD